LQVGIDWGSDMAHRIFWLIVALVAFAVFGPLPSTAQNCSDGKCIRIGSYNIKYFASKGPADTKGEIDELVNRIVSVDQGNFDVLVLQEIRIKGKNWNGSSGLRKKLDGLGYAVAKEGSFGATKAKAKEAQHLVLLYKTKTVSLIKDSVDEIKIPTTFNEGGCFYDSLRPPVTARFTTANGTFAFRVIGVHLKSQLGEGSCNTAMRKHQSALILKDIAKFKTQNNESNFVVVGDFNSPFDNADFDAFRQAGFESVIKGNCSEQKMDECSYLGNPGQYPPELIDHIVVPSGMKGALAGSGTIKIGNLKTYLNSQSDHAPVWASFRID
jgi:endonuclease/exonuclease/phosphatase family metal-dependent hydrolase